MKWGDVLPGMMLVDVNADYNKFVIGVEPAASGEFKPQILYDLVYVIFLIVARDGMIEFKKEIHLVHHLVEDHAEFVVANGVSLE